MSDSGGSHVSSAGEGLNEDDAFCGQLIPQHGTLRQQCGSEAVMFWTTMQLCDEPRLTRDYIQRVWW